MRSDDGLLQRLAIQQNLLSYRTFVAWPLIHRFESQNIQKIRYGQLELKKEEEVASCKSEYTR